MSLSSKSRAFILLVGFTCVAVLLLAASPSWAATLTVNDDTTGSSPPGADCAMPNHDNIQDAVDAATAGDTILVCAGEYVEQVGIDKNLTITGAGAENTTIKTPDTIEPNDEDEGVLVDIFDGAQVAMSQIEVAGPKPPPLTCSFAEALDIGIWVRDASDLDLSDADVTDIRDEPLSGCQTGIGVFVGGSFAGTTGTANIENVDFTGYQKGGIVVSNTGSDATITDNTITGAGNTETIAQNGIQVDDGAEATIESNEISDHLCDTGTPNNNTCGPDPIDNVQSTGIILFDAGDVTISGNDIFDNDAGVLAGVQAGSAATVSDNTLSDNRYQGIFAFDGTVEVNDNSISGGNTGIAAVSFDDGSQPTVNAIGNTIVDNDSGIEALSEGETAPSPIVAANFNRIFGNDIGIANNATPDTDEVGALAVEQPTGLDAENNWWGCNEGPNNDSGCDTTEGEVDSDPHLIMDIAANPTTVAPGGNSAITVSFDQNSDGMNVASDFPDGTLVSFTATNGTVNPGEDETMNALAETVFTASNAEGNASVTGSLDAEEVTVDITVEEDDDGGPDPDPDPNACTITGTNGDDNLRGTSGRDVICGLGGNDRIIGLGGDDILRGQGGDDLLRGGDGDDELDGGSGGDLLKGEGGRDRLDARDGVKGNDFADGGPGRDSCSADRRDVTRSC